MTIRHRSRAERQRHIKSFGEDEAGEIYVLSMTKLGPNGGTGDDRRLAQP
jgi:hypothetical protein